MKYRFKIDTPWGKKGTIAPEVIRSSSVLNHYHSWAHIEVDPDEFPQIFEPIEEKSDEEYLGFYLFERSGPLSGDESMKLAERLLSSNAINPDFLVKLRKGDR